MQTVRISWNDSVGETTVSLTRGFQNLELISKLDNLQDAMHQITELYNQTVTEFQTKEQDDER